ncbi:MAG: hypothetical protein JST93_18355 [Acidobacteria bacterium]|nr:hypothetical protein [Acidobacteriota bacterium]
MKQAIVLGGSMAGLVTAGVLAKHYGRVTVVEQDVLPESVEQRRGAPQGRHAHGLLAGGGRALEELFPGLSDELRRDGAVPADVARDLRWFHEGGCLARFRSGLDGFLLSRPLIETAVRRRVKALPNVRFLEGQRVDGLMATANRSRVVGVRIGGEELSADLVVDTTGRGSQTPQWLEMMGYRKPVEERVEVALAYTTRLFRWRPEHLNGDGAAVIPSTPEGKVGGVMLRQEGERWIVTLIGHFGHQAPEDLAGFIEYARHLPAPYIYEVIRHAEPIGEACSARFPASVRRRYERLDRFPEGYLVMGDAICSFNPKYGQGMTVTALEGKALDECLAEGGERLAQRFHRRAAEVVDIPWAIAVGNDLRMKETVGPRSLGVRFINWYMAQLHKAAHEDAVLSMAFHQVANLLAPPQSVMAPGIAWRVARHALFPRQRREPAKLSEASL